MESSISPPSLSPEQQFIAERYCVLYAMYKSDEAFDLINGPPHGRAKPFNKGARLAKAGACQEHTAGMLRVYAVYLPADKAKAYRERYERLEALAPLLEKQFDPLSTQAKKYKDDCRGLFEEVSAAICHAHHIHVLPHLCAEPVPPYSP